MASPRAFEVFAFYHLGLDREFEYAFRNVNQAAAYFSMGIDELGAFLETHRMDPETIRHVDFNLSAAHADAQMMDLDGASIEARETFAKDTWKRYQAALQGSYDKSRQFDDVDWDNPLGLESE